MNLSRFQCSLVFHCFFIHLLNAIVSLVTLVCSISYGVRLLSPSYIPAWIQHIDHQYLLIQKTSRRSRHMLTDESTKLSRAMFEQQGGQQDPHKDVCVRKSWQKWWKVTSHSWKWVITRNVDLTSSSYFRQRYHWHPAQPAGAVLERTKVDPRPRDFKQNL